MFRLKYLANALALPLNAIIRRVCLRHRKKLYCKYNNVWFQFPSQKDVIVPQAEALTALNMIRKTLSPSAQRKMDILTLNDLSSFEFQSLDSLPAADSSLPPKKRILTVAILGHFNHGKTTLLDAFCNTDLVSTELHGITQIIRTRLVNFAANPTATGDGSGDGGDSGSGSGDGGDLSVTFVDTPGQDIFFRMRNYGAEVADFAILMVSAEDGVGPQTQESIGLLESLKIPSIVCINKIDLPVVRKSSNRVPELEQQLRKFVALENSIFIPISAKTIFELSAKITKQNEGKVFTKTPMATYPKIDPRDYDDKRDVGLKCYGGIFISGYGTVLDTWTNRKGGTVLHAIVKHGQVRVGDNFSAGGWSGKVRAILHDYDKSIPLAHAGYAACFSVSTHPEIGDPRPLGDRIYFLSNGQNKQDAQVIPALVRKMAPILVEKGAKALAEHIMQQQQMELALGSYAISQEVAEHYWLPKLEARMRGFKKSPFFAAEDGEENGKGKHNKKGKGKDKGKEKGKDKGKGKVAVIGSGSGKEVENKVSVVEVGADTDAEEEGEVDREEDQEDDGDEDDNEDDEDDDAAEGEEGDGDEDDSEEDGDVDSYDEGEGEVRKENESVQSSRGREDSSVDGELPNIIVKADTDISLSTIMDSFEERFENQSVAGEDSDAEAIIYKPPVKIVYGGSGSVNGRDILVAKAANAVVLTYKIYVEREANRQAQNQNVRILSFDRMQDVIDIVLGRVSLEAAVAVNAVPHKKI